jgi:hypothetical protein
VCERFGRRVDAAVAEHGTGSVLIGAVPRAVVTGVAVRAVSNRYRRRPSCATAASIPGTVEDAVAQVLRETTRLTRARR